MNCKKVLFDWLNSYEYHRDAEKRESVDSLLSNTPDQLLQGILVSLIVEQITAIELLWKVVNLILGSHKQLQFDNFEMIAVA